MSEPEKRFYFPQLDGLRFFAFLLVFLHHAPILPGGSRAAAFAKQMGWMGVDLFFVLSAYLLFALLDREYALTGTVDFKRFYIRRALRIWPLFYFYIAACFLYFVTVDGGRFPAVGGRTIGHLFFVDNFFTAISNEYNPLNFTPHLWTIAFEEQIYLFMPLLLLGGVYLRKHRKLFIAAGVVIMGAQLLLRVALAAFYTRERAVWVTPIVHFDTIFAGLVLGTAAGSTFKLKAPGDLIALAGASVLIAVFFLPPDADFSRFLPDRNPAIFSLLALAFFLIVLGCLDERSWITWLLAKQPLVFLGRISYGLYVWHWIGNRFGLPVAVSLFPGVANVSNDFTDWLSVVLPSFLLTVALSVSSYFVLERPFLRLKRRFTIVPNRID